MSTRLSCVCVIALTACFQKPIREVTKAWWKNGINTLTKHVLPDRRRDRAIAGRNRKIPQITMAMLLGTVILSSGYGKTFSGPLVRTESGIIKGSRDKGVDSFLGLPFAAPHPHIGETW
ncbi:hypothetical protein [Komagataeibacter rhaeticus]|uniref:hypothetical protein n=1 Tax=Komagataeibacter rhaeticus TaxID=215221 RepID=UPI0039E78286